MGCLRSDLETSVFNHNRHVRFEHVRRLVRMSLGKAEAAQFKHVRACISVKLKTATTNWLASSFRRYTLGISSCGEKVIKFTGGAPKLHHLQHLAVSHQSQTVRHCGKLSPMSYHLSGDHGQYHLNLSVVECQGLPGSMPTLLRRHLCGDAESGSFM